MGAKLEASVINPDTVVKLSTKPRQTSSTLTEGQSLLRTDKLQAVCRSGKSGILSRLRARDRERDALEDMLPQGNRRKISSGKQSMPWIASTDSTVQN